MNGSDSVMSMKQVLIVGFGCAGYHAAKAMRESGFDGDIHVFSESDDAPVNPMLTTHHVDGNTPFKSLPPLGSLCGLAREFNLIVHSGYRITYIDYEKKLALRNDGAVYPYDQLLLATGASAVKPSFPGSRLAGVYTMRTMRDASLLKEHLDFVEVRKAVIVGASAVGIKIAEFLHKRGIDITLTDTATHVFPLAALPNTASLIENRVKVKGVELLLGHGISGIVQKDDHLVASFSDGVERDCDIAVLCIGTQANTQLAGDAVKVRKGIVANSLMQTSVPDVYTAGDCCECLDKQRDGTDIIGLWANAAMQGDIAGKNMAGILTHCEGNIPHNITRFFDMDFISFGDVSKTGKQISYESPDGNFLIQAVLENDKIHCVNILDCAAASGVLKSFFMKRLIEPDTVLCNNERVRLSNQGVPGWFIRELERLPRS